MSERNYTRQTFLIQMASGFAALAIGCGDDSEGGDTDTDATTDPTQGSTTESMTSEGTTTSPTGGSETTASTDPTTGDPSTSSSSGGEESGSSSSGGGDSSSSSTGGEASACSEDILSAEISNNHGHTLEIPLADIDAGVETTYDATGDSGHCHEVVLTADDFATLRAGGTVIKFSCNGGDHEYVLNCAGRGKPPGAPDCADDPQFGSCP